MNPPERQGGEEITLSELQQSPQLAGELIDLIEKERKKMAEELHDHIGNILTLVKTNIEMLADNLQGVDSQLRATLQSTQEIMGRLIGEIRDLSQGLCPTCLIKTGLIPSIASLIEDYAKNKLIEIRFFHQDIPESGDYDQKLSIYRIVQEALTNIIKHAGAKQVFINILGMDETMVITIEDDGRGFDGAKIMEHAEAKGCLGLRLIQERVTQLQGQLIVSSSPDQGTYLRIEIPWAAPPTPSG